MTLTPQHAGFFNAHTHAARIPQRRGLAIVLTAAIEIGLAYTLLTALGVTPAPTIIQPCACRIIPTHEKNTEVPPPPLPPIPQPTIPRPIEREIILQPFESDAQNNSITEQAITQEHPTTPVPLPPVTLSPPRAIAATHTTPDYPVLSRRLGEQGAARLKLTIAPDGMVSGATVVNSSGYPRLDDAAVQWVVSHWRYQPAMKGTMPVASTAEAVVTFALK